MHRVADEVANVLTDRATLTQQVALHDLPRLLLDVDLDRAVRLPSRRLVTSTRARRQRALLALDATAHNTSAVLLVLVFDRGCFERETAFTR